MIQDTVRTWYVICVYPIHGRDTRNTCLYKRKKSKSPQEDIYKNIFFRDFFFFLRCPFRLVIATLMPSSNDFQQQLSPSDDDLHHPRAQEPRSRVPPAGCSLPLTFILNFTASDIEHSCIPQFPHAMQGSTPIFFLFIYKTIPKIKKKNKAAISTAAGPMCVLVAKDISRV